MKKIFYIFMFGILGLLLAFLLQAVIEFFMILRLSWSQVLFFRPVFIIVLTIVGLVWGIFMGFRCWQYIYVDKKYTGRWFKIK